MCPIDENQSHPAIEDKQYKDRQPADAAGCGHWFRYTKSIGTEPYEWAEEQADKVLTYSSWGEFEWMQERDGVWAVYYPREISAAR